MLPVHLMTNHRPFEDPPGGQWAIAVGAGVLVTILNWLLDGAGSGRVHPVLVAYLLLVVIFKSTLIPHWVLQKDHLFLGNVREAAPVELTAYPEGWRTIPPKPHEQALYEQSPAEQLTQFTSGQKQPDRSWFSLDGLLRDEMPPLEDLIMGGQPGPIGTTSAVAVIVGGLFLLYRGVIDFRIPLLVFTAAFIALLVLPIPSVVKEVTTNGITHAQIDWRWLPLRAPAIGAAKAITFANYEVMAGPLLFLAFFLATAPEIRPLTRRGRAVYALLVGVCAAVLQLYISVSFGPYLALLLVSLLTPALDRFLKPNCLV
jgi:Na+-translocating ferredoxin:NAD+ oxidoreductase RnfD subunit